MENKFMPKPTPKSDKTTKAVFIGLLVALPFVIAGIAIFFALMVAVKALKARTHQASRVVPSIQAAMQRILCSKSP